MKRLFLASSGLAFLPDFVGSDPSSLRMLFIPTAGNLDTNVWWIDKDRDVLADMGFQITEYDIEYANPAEHGAVLSNTDIVYIAGGNTFYLLKQLRVSNFDTALTDFVEKGGLYAGASAGALIAGADISPIASIDEPEKVVDLPSTKGLNLINIVPIPHYNMHERTPAINSILKHYGDTLTLVPLTDDQAIVVEADQWHIVSSPRSDRERGWFTRAKIHD